MTNFPFTALGQIDDVESRNWAGAALDAGRDPVVLAAVNARGRDHPRTPMQRDAGPNAGFTTGVPWLPVNPNYPEVNAKAQVGDPESVFAHFQQLIALRRRLPVVVDGDFSLLLPERPSVYAFLRTLPGEQLLVVANLSSQPVQADLPGGWEGSEVLVASGPAVLGGPAGSLAPCEARVPCRASA